MTWCRNGDERRAVAGKVICTECLAVLRKITHQIVSEAKTDAGLRILAARLTAQQFCLDITCD